jgi:hypothetical protein
MEQHNPCQHSLASSWTNLPFFIKPIDGTRDLLDLDYLAQKDAFYIPPQPCQQELVSSYVDWVHPFFPFLDNDCLEGIRRGPESPFRSLADGQISLLLWQAMMFAATAVSSTPVHESQLLTSVTDTSSFNPYSLSTTRACMRWALIADSPHVGHSTCERDSSTTCKWRKIICRCCRLHFS